MSSAREKTREGRRYSARIFKEEGRAGSRSDKPGLIAADISQEFKLSNLLGLLSTTYKKRNEKVFL